MSTHQDVNALRAQRIANTHDPLALMANTQTPFHQDQLSQNRQMLMVDDNVRNPFRQNVVQNVGHLVGQGIQNVGNRNGLSVFLEIANQYGNGNVKTTPAEGNGNGINEEFEFMAAADAYAETERVKVICTSKDTLQQASTSGTQSDNAPIYNSDGSTELLEPIPEPRQVQQNDSNVISAVSSVEQGGGTVEQYPANLSKEKSTVSSLQEEKKRLKSDLKIRKDELLDKQIQLENKIKELDNILVKTEAAKFVRDFQSLAKEADEFLAKYKALELEIERLLKVVVSQDIMSIVQNKSVIDTSNLQTELERMKERFENCIIKKENETSEQKDTTKGMSVNTQSRKQSILGKSPSSYGSKLYYVTPLPKSKVFPKVSELNALSKPVTSNSTPSSHESTVVNNKRVIAPGIFRINLLKLLG
ncbi:hypothetical protein Tco_1038148 [Tanacetum coccineum]